MPGKSKGAGFGDRQANNQHPSSMENPANSADGNGPTDASPMAGARLGASERAQETTHDHADPVIFPRPAPTFHTEEKRTVGGEAWTDTAGVSLVSKFETMVRQVRCVRCRRNQGTTSINYQLSVGVPIPGFGGLGGEVSRSRETTEDVSSRVPEGVVAYLVIGIISAVDWQPVEKIVFFRDTDRKHLFWKILMATIQLRGVQYFLSLKSIKAFRLYRCVTSTGSHKQLEMDGSALSDLKQLMAVYKAWSHIPPHINEGWADWVFDCLDGGSLDVMNEGTYSLEIVLGWSPTRISVAVLSPVVLSFVVGIWFNSRDWADLATIQTAWGVASYIATAGGRKCLPENDSQRRILIQKSDELQNRCSGVGYHQPPGGQLDRSKRPLADCMELDFDPILRTAAEAENFCKQSPQNPSHTVLSPHARLPCFE